MIFWRNTCVKHSSNQICFYGMCKGWYDWISSHILGLIFSQHLWHQYKMNIGTLTHSHIHCRCIIKQNQTRIIIWNDKGWKWLYELKNLKSTHSMPYSDPLHIKESVPFATSKIMIKIDIWQIRDSWTIIDYPFRNNPWITYNWIVDVQKIMPPCFNFGTHSSDEDQQFTFR